MHTPCLYHAYTTHMYHTLSDDALGAGGARPGFATLTPRYLDITPDVT